MNWQDIPSLAALRAVEAAARLGSFAAAGRELNVTHAAIAQHVRLVETHLGVPLVHRAGRGIGLTTEGQILAAALTTGFQHIGDGIAAVSSDAQTRPFALSITPSFAEQWLMPRFASFWAAHPDFNLSIQPSMEVLDLRREGIDMAIRYGRGDWPGLEATKLISVDVTVIARHDLIEDRTISSISDLQDLPWIFESVRKEDRRWVAAQGLDLEAAQVNLVPTFGMAMAAVRAGKALSVAPSPLVADDIANGTLRQLMRAHPKGLAYYIVHPKGVVSSRLRTLKSWLLAEAKA